MADGDLEKSKKRNEKLLTENRELKSEKEAIEKENVELRCPLKKLRKEHKDAAHDLEKRNKQLEMKLRDLDELKDAKVSEERELKTRQKKVDKKLRLIEEKEAKLKVDKDSFERLQKGDDANQNVIEEAAASSQPSLEQLHPSLVNCMKEPPNHQSKSASYNEAHEESVKHYEEIVEPNIPVNNLYDKLLDETCEAKVSEPCITSTVKESLEFFEEQMKRLSNKMDKNLELSQKIAHNN